MVAARAFIKGLETGRDVVSEALKVRGYLSMGGAQGGERRCPLRKSQMPAGRRDVELSHVSPEALGPQGEPGRRWARGKSPWCPDS